MASGPTENPGPQERSHGSDQALPCGGDCFMKDFVGGWRRKLSSSLCSVGGQYDACRGAGPRTAWALDSSQYVYSLSGPRINPAFTSQETS